MQQIQVNALGLQPAQGVMQVGAQVTRRQPIGLQRRPRVPALADQKQALTVAPRAQPLPQEPLGATELIASGGVEGGASELEYPIEIAISLGAVPRQAEQLVQHASQP